MAVIWAVAFGAWRISDLNDGIGRCAANPLNGLTRLILLGAIRPGYILASSPSGLTLTRFESGLTSNRGGCDHL